MEQSIHEVNALEKGLVKIYCGETRGKTTLAMGRAVMKISAGKVVYVIQFLKGRMDESLDCLRRLEPELKIFRFEETDRVYEDLDDQMKLEENQNILNAMNFARKVLSVGECDVLVLDEILKLVDYHIIEVEDIIKLIEKKPDYMEMILTGVNLPKELEAYADYISRIDVIKDVAMNEDH